MADRGESFGAGEPLTPAVQDAVNVVADAIVADLTVVS